MCCLVLSIIYFSFFLLFYFGNIDLVCLTFHFNTTRNRRANEDLSEIEMKMEMEMEMEDRDICSQQIDERQMFHMHVRLFLFIFCVRFSTFIRNLSAFIKCVVVAFFIRNSKLKWNKKQIQVITTIALQMFSFIWFDWTIDSSSTFFLWMIFTNRNLNRVNQHLINSLDVSKVKEWKGRAYIGTIQFGFFLMSWANECNERAIEQSVQQIYVFFLVFLEHIIQQTGWHKHQSKKQATEMRIPCLTFSFKAAQKIKPSRTNWGKSRKNL